MAISYLVIGPLFLSLNLLQSVTGDCRDGWTKFQGSCYLFASDQASWPEAEAFCLSMNSNLVEIGSESENAFVEGELKIIHGHDSHSSHQNEVSYWLGGNDLEMEGTFKWVRSDAPLVFTDWNPGQPDDFSSGEDCIELQGAMDYHWNDLSCSARHRFICESSAYGPDSGAISSVIGKR
ncbi:echinoidin-like [Crassostrea angulata]|uniref:echinoidin-like n=1 Tax=Magallana angulata TaxID=2784310 RepID=UPI0005C35782|nr:echinoidin-like [Crassostrea angulata]|eukprot:XP_011457092.1 PREDICTED: echinoidin-like isoform X1 [Crassostrea gigas]